MYYYVTSYICSCSPRICTNSKFLGVMISVVSYREVRDFTVTTCCQLMLLVFNMMGGRSMAIHIRQNAM